MSKHSVRGGDVAELMAHFATLRDKAHARAGASFPIIAIQEAGLDGFWVHRVLERAGIESHVVDAASDLAAAAPGEDGPHRWRGAAANALGVQARRTPRLHHGQGTEPGGGGPAPALPRAQDAGGGAGGARQPDQGSVVRPGYLRLRAPAQ